MKEPMPLPGVAARGTEGVAEEVAAAEEGEDGEAGPALPRPPPPPLPAPPHPKQGKDMIHARLNPPAAPPSSVE